MKKLSHLLAGFILGLLTLSALAVVPSTTVGDANFTVTTTTTNIRTTTAFTAARTWTLPAANATCIGQNCAPAAYSLNIIDTAGAVSSSNTLTIARASGDTINGAAADLTINYPGSRVVLVPTSANNWQAFVSANSTQSSPTGTTTTNAATALGNYWNVLSKTTLSATGIVSGNGRGGRRELDLSGTVTGGAFIMGGQDKLIVTGTMNHADSRLAGGYSQVDGSGGVFTTGQLSVHWFDWGATAPSGGWNTGGQANTVRFQNTTGSNVNSHVYVYGKADYFGDFSNNSSAWLDATTGGSTQTGRIKILVNGAPRYIHVFSD